MALIAGTANPDILTGTALPDTIQGLASDDVIYGFDGNDLLQGGTGDDILYGGSGDDFLDGGGGEDLFFGQSGRDTVTYASATAGLTLNLLDAAQSTGEALGDWFLSVENFVLSGFNDTFTGSAFAEEVHGAAGGDLLQGGGGNDRLFGEAGNDTLDGGAGADSLVGGTGDNRASYASSLSGIVLSVADMTNASGDAAGDSFTGIAGLILTSFADAVTLGGTILRADGGAGNDTLVGAGGRDTLLGGVGHDQIRGNDGNDQLFGDQGNDSLSGGNGGDLLSGGDGTDLLSGGAGADTLGGGAGTDTVHYGASVRLDLTNPATSTGEAKGDVLTGIEVLSFAGLGAGSVYVGGAGAMRVELIAGALSCLAGSGAESFVNIFGAMTVSYQNAASAVTLIGGDILTGSRAASGDVLSQVTGITLSGFADVLQFADPFRTLPLTIRTGNGADTITVNVSGVDLIDLGGGNDDLSGGFGRGHVNCGAGNDTVNLGPDFIPAVADAAVFGGAGNDVLNVGGFGSSHVDGGDGDDVLDIDGVGNGTVVGFGGAGNDVISATGGSCDIEGGLGDDEITASADLHDFLGGEGLGIRGGDGNDTITATSLSFVSEVDGEAGDDVMILSGFAGVVQGGTGNDDVKFILFVSGAGGCGALGGEGNDTLTVESEFIGTTLPGNTALLVGGAGNDTLIDLTLAAFVFAEFRFQTGWGDDTLSGFSNGVDRIVFSGTAAGGLDGFDDLVVTGDATHTLVSFGTDSIDLIGFDIAQFDVADVLFV